MAVNGWSPKTRISPLRISLVGRIPKSLQRALLATSAYLLLALFFSNAGLPLSPTLILHRFLSPTPAHTPSTFPKKIWQTWPLSPLHFEDRERDRAKTWIERNPGFQYEVLTDENALSYVERYFGPAGLDRADIVATYRELEIKIIKADFLRYLVMYVEGGVYADIDVEALKPVDQWGIENWAVMGGWREEDVDLVIGVEVDEPTFLFHPIMGPKCTGFCQWTFMAKPRTPVLMGLIEDVMRWLQEMVAKQGKGLGEIELVFDDVIKGTGPTAFTEAMMGEMRRQTGRSDLGWDEFHALKGPKKMGRILVLTIDAFAAGQDHSGSGSHESELAMVKHHYHATSWTDSFTRYSHPAYGMAEECGFHMECLLEWDRNTTAFPSLPEEEQQRLIAAHEDYWRPENVAARDKAAREEWERNQRMWENEEKERVAREQFESEGGTAAEWERGKKERMKKEEEEREERERREREAEAREAAEREEKENREREEREKLEEEEREAWEKKFAEKSE
jgi:mannosyltransferase OCH1-like enzyme